MGHDLIPVDPRSQGAQSPVPPAPRARASTAVHSSRQPLLQTLVLKARHPLPERTGGTEQAAGPRGQSGGTEDSLSPRELPRRREGGEIRRGVAGAGGGKNRPEHGRGRHTLGVGALTVRKKLFFLESTCFNSTRKSQELWDTRLRSEEQIK